MNELVNENLIKLIRAVFWGSCFPEVNQEIYEEARIQAIASLLGPELTKIELSPEQQNSWNNIALQQVTFYCQYKYEQEKLPLTVPYVILKGTSAGQYYPHPEYRTLGDIDIMTRREDFDIAYQQLKDNGYQLVKDLDREKGLIKNGILVELHRYFAKLNDPHQAKYLDDLIISNINAEHVLPNLINGLVLLEHISQHMENGIGLRHIIDWMMFVDKCLPDDQWSVFQKEAKNIGLEKLAITVTRMCELYLGLPVRNWCNEVDETLCEELMEYVMACGNFGVKRVNDSDYGENVFTLARTPKAAFYLLQKQGVMNWPLAKKYYLVRPFAWIYQSGRYVSKGLFRKHALRKLNEEYKTARKRKKLFDALEIRQVYKGVIRVKDGDYVKKWF